ncbi:hypothetical protein VTJ04DRAFT_10715 [Mycothermus thermophilus]|uniref:uncharacterized protein n=1 Tax=Humicola insolens TaxID=85995 RepID=UPI00374484AC
MLSYRSRSHWDTVKQKALNDLVGDESGLKLVSTTQSRSQRDLACFVRNMNLMLEGHVVGYYKEVLLNPGSYYWSLHREQYRLSQREADNLTKKLKFGRPLHPPLEAWLVNKRTGTPSNLPNNSFWARTGLPVFEIDPAEIPPEVIQLLGEWMKEHPHDLIYYPVAIQKILQWIWIVEDLKRRLEDNLSHVNHPVPHVSLSAWLILAHLFEAFHQANRLAWYIHPFRFVHHVLNGSRRPENTDSTSSHGGVDKAKVKEAKAPNAIKVSAIEVKLITI